LKGFQESCAAEKDQLFTVKLERSRRANRKRCCGPVRHCFPRSDDGSPQPIQLQRDTRALLRLASHFGKPPAKADEKKTPILKELGRLALKGVADELEDPADDEEADGEYPEAGVPEDEWGNEDAECDHGDADGVAGAIDRVLVAGGVLTDPISPTSVSEHGAPPEF
jgi:hypothetical protein